MFNRGREEKELAQVTNEIAPYRNVVISYETDQRLEAADMELIAEGRHVVTSNDRYQFASAYLVLARNRAVMTDAIADTTLDPAAAASDLKGEQFDYSAVTNFLVGGYQAATDSLETADRISSVKGYQATPDETAILQAVLNGVAWPAPEQVSRRFLAGAIQGLRAITIATNAQYLAMEKSHTLAGNMKFRLKQQVDPVRAIMETKQSGIEMITRGNIDGIKSIQALADVYRNIIEAAAAADLVGIWLTVPKLLDGSFTLSKPLDELRPQGKSFDPSTVGSPAVSRAVQSAPPQAVTPKRSFDPGSLQSPAPTPSLPPAAGSKPFNPGGLTTPVAPAPPVQPPSRKSFDPDALKTPEKRAFDPSSLGKPAVENTAKTADYEEPEHPLPRNKPFDPRNLL